MAMASAWQINNISLEHISVRFLDCITVEHRTRHYDTYRINGEFMFSPNLPSVTSKQGMHFQLITQKKSILSNQNLLTLATFSCPGKLLKRPLCPRDGAQQGPLNFLLPQKQLKCPVNGSINCRHFSAKYEVLKNHSHYLQVNTCQ